MSEQPWDELFEAYMAGELDEEQRTLFMHCLESSDEAKKELAAMVGTDRLLRAAGQPAVSVADIMYAVLKDQPKPAHPEPPVVAQPKPSPRAQKKVWHWPIGLAAVILLGVGVAIKKLVSRPDRFDPPVVSPTPGVEPPAQGVSVTPPAAAPSETKAEVTTPKPGPERVVQAAPMTRSQAFPLDPPRVDGLPDPTRDGSLDPGFVPPPTSAEAPLVVPPPDPFGPVPPTLVAKLVLGDDPAPNDLTRLLAYAAGEHRLSSRFVSIHPSELSDDPSSVPVLYLNSHYHFAFSPERRRILRRFILNGGMIVMNAGGGSAPAAESARREMAQIFPEIPMQRLSADHPLYHAYFDVKEPPPIEGLTLSCRTAVILLPEGMAKDWQGEESTALQFGVNLLSYATAVRAWAKRTEHTRSFLGAGDAQGDTLFVAQIEHQGEWRTRYTGLPNLLHSYNQRTEVPVRFDVKSLPLTNAEIFNHPLLYLTGHEPLRFSAREIVALRRYLENGGFLLAEACCGRAGFDRSFRRLMGQLFPVQPLERVASDAELFTVPNRIELLGVTQKLGAKSGSMLMRPHLEGIKFGEQFGVIYSPYGIAGGWEMSQTPYADGYEDPDTLKLGQNILHYAISQ